MTIRKKLTVLYAGFLTIIIILFGVTVFSVMRLVMIGNIDQTLRDTAEHIVFTSLINEPNGNIEGDAPLIEVAPLDIYRASAVYVQVWVSDGGEYTLHESSANIAWHDAAPIHADGIHTHVPTFANIDIDGNNFRVLTHPIIVDGMAMGIIQAGESLEIINQTTDTLFFIMVVTCVVAIIGGNIITMWFSQRALEPIEEVTRVAARVAGTNDLSTRLAWNGPDDEVGRLISVFNHMMTRIQHLFSVQQRFIADMSHELRTPLTVIKGNLELVQRYGMDDTSLEAIESETERISRLVNDLLMLARADYGGIKIDLHPINLASVVKDAFEEGKLLAVGRELDIKLSSIDQVEINGNIGRLHQLIVNVMSNAINFTENGGEIVVTLQKGTKNAILTVSDTGIGIVAAEQERIFDRFYQVNSSRHHEIGEGFGLGLSVAKWITHAHGGTIEVASIQGKGTTFGIKIPLYGTVKITETDEFPVSRVRLHRENQNTSNL